MTKPANRPGVIIERNQRPFIEFDLLPRGSPLRLRRARGWHPTFHEGLQRRRYHRACMEGHGLSAQTIAAYRELWEKGELTVRVALTLSHRVAATSQRREPS